MSEEFKIYQSFFDVAIKLPSQSVLPFIYVDYIINEDNTIDNTTYQIKIRPNLNNEYESVTIKVYINGELYETQKMETETEFSILRKISDEPIIVSLEGYYTFNGFNYNFNRVRYIILAGPICAPTTLCSNALFCGEIDI